MYFYSCTWSSDWMFAARAGLTVILTTYDLIALDLSDVVYELHDGRFVDTTRKNTNKADK